MNFNKAEFETSFAESEKLPESDLQEVVFCGKSNVGKSSLLNRLLQRKNLAYVSATPGKTATINFFKVDGVRFVDLPGYGYAKVSKAKKEAWAELMEGYFQMGRDILLVVLLIDMRHPPSRDDLAMAEYLIEYEFPFVVALTKCDKLSKTERIERRAALCSELPNFDEITSVELSSATGEGIDMLKGIISEVCED